MLNIRDHFPYLQKYLGQQNRLAFIKYHVKGKKYITKTQRSCRFFWMKKQKDENRSQFTYLINSKAFQIKMNFIICLYVGLRTNLE